MLLAQQCRACAGRASSAAGALPEPKAQRERRPVASAGPVPSARPVAHDLSQVRNVLLITVDALRADQPWTGYAGVKTPHLSQLAAESVVYTRAYALANTTSASLGGIFGGRYPTEIPRDACILARYDMTGGLAPVLKKGGVRTFAAHGHALFAGDTAPRLGFDEWRLISGAAGRMQSDGAIPATTIADRVSGTSTSDVRAGASYGPTSSIRMTPTRLTPSFRSGPGARPLRMAKSPHTDRAIGRVLASIKLPPRGDTRRSS